MRHNSSPSSSTPCPRVGVQGVGVTVGWCKFNALEITICWALGRFRIFSNSPCTSGAAATASKACCRKVSKSRSGTAPSTMTSCVSVSEVTVSSWVCDDAAAAAILFCSISCVTSAALAVASPILVKNRNGTAPSWVCDDAAAAAIRFCCISCHMAAHLAVASSKVRIPMAMAPPGCLTDSTRLCYLLWKCHENFFHDFLWKFMTWYVPRTWHVHRKNVHEKLPKLTALSVASLECWMQKQQKYTDWKWHPHWIKCTINLNFVLL